MGWRELVEYARWAPSPHNIQPWRLRPRSERDADLLYDPARLLPDTDSSGRFTTCALGIFVESLAIAAAADGLALEAELDGAPLRAGPPGAQLFAKLTLAPGAEAEPLDRRLLLERRTSRVPYDGRPVEPELLDELGRIAAGYGHELTASSDPGLVAWTVELNRETLFYDMADATARREVGRWLRFSGREAARRRDGFSPEALGFPGWLLLAFFHAHGLLEAPGLRRIVRALYGRTMRGTRTIAWLAGPFERTSDCFAAGRMLARLWLTLEQAGVRLHPFGSVITNPRAHARLRERIDVDEAAGEVWLLMRLGRSPRPPRSHRLEADELLVA